jgi:non-specific serine/threonine protein kinase
MLETIREYGLDQLGASGEAEAMRRAHLAYYLGLAEAAEPELAGPEQAPWLDRLEAEHDNLRAALAWAVDREEDDTALRLSTALLSYWQTRCTPREGVGWVEQALTRAATAGPSLRARALLGHGPFAIALGDFARAQTAFAETLALRREAGDRPGIAQALTGLGFVESHQGVFPAARALLEEALAIRRELGDRPGLASARRATWSRRVTCIARHWHCGASWATPTWSLTSRSTWRSSTAWKGTGRRRAGLSNKPSPASATLATNLASATR